MTSPLYLLNQYIGVESDAVSRFPTSHQQYERDMGEGRKNIYLSYERFFGPIHCNNIF